MTAKLHVIEKRTEIVTGLAWDREFDRGAFYHHHSSSCMQNIMRRAMADWPGACQLVVTTFAMQTTLKLVWHSGRHGWALEEGQRGQSRKWAILGLRLNVSHKTKIMAIGPDSVEEPLIIDGNEVESVFNFNILGSLITKDGICSHGGQQIRHRLASGTFSNDKPVQDLGWQRNY